jgi:hypothetical protein
MRPPENGQSNSLLFEVSIGDTVPEVLQNIAQCTGLGTLVPRLSKKDEAV